MIAQVIFLFVENNFALVDEGNIVGNFLQVGCNVGGHHNRVIFVLHKFQKYIQYVIPHNRIETAGSFVQNQQFGVVGEGNGDAQFYFHALGHLFELFIQRKLKSFQIVLVQMIIPLTICCPCNFSNFSRGQGFIEIDAIKYNANVLFELFR